MDLLDSSNLILLLVLACVGLIVVGSVLLFFFVFRAARDPKIDKGLLGQATILKIWETGLRVNDRPQVGFLLNIQHPDGSTYEAETKAVISVIHLPQFQPGATVAVKIDVNDRQRVALA
jgi:hypothetical protein